MEDPRAAYSYRHPASGEWAHPLHAGPLADAFATYVDPAWERLAARVQAAPAGPPGADRPWQGVILGFGRGFETVALLRRLRQEAPRARWDLAGFEPNPQWLRPWPARWPEFAADEAPWWGRSEGAWEDGPRRLTLHAQRALEHLRGLPAGCLDLVILDLFSPGRAPEDWEDGLWAALGTAAAPGAVLTTYTCARTVRDGLATAGWKVERLRNRGPRDTLRAEWSAEAQA